MYQIDEIVVTKKAHVCGNDKWKIIRTGADIKMKCEGCGRIILISKVELDKKIKKNL